MKDKTKIQKPSIQFKKNSIPNRGQRKIQQHFHPKVNHVVKNTPSKIGTREIVKAIISSHPSISTLQSTKSTIETQESIDKNEAKFTTFTQQSTTIDRSTVYGNTTTKVVDSKQLSIPGYLRIEDEISFRLSTKLGEGNL